MRNFTRIILLNLAMIMCLSVAGCTMVKEDTSSTPTAEIPTQSAVIDPTVTPDASTSTPTAVVQTQSPTNTPTQAPTNVPNATPAIVEGEGAVLWQVATNALSMSYVIKTKNNKIIVIDGGGDSNSGTYNGQKYPKNEIDALMKVLKEATGQQVPTVDAWILTHCHSDHINVFSHLITNASGTIKLGKLYYNFPTDEYLYKAGFKQGDETSTLGKFKKALAKLTDDQIVTVQEGKSYTVDNVTFNIILAPDESIKDATFLSNAINESSIVFDMKLGGQRVLFLGDLGPYSNGRFAAAMRKTESRYVDIVQMAHHGSQGITKEYCWSLRPKACLWPSPSFMWDDANQAGGGGALSLETKAVYDYLVKKGVKHHYMMTDGTIKLEFPLDLS